MKKNTSDRTCRIFGMLALVLIVVFLVPWMSGSAETPINHTSAFYPYNDQQVFYLLSEPQGQSENHHNHNSSFLLMCIISHSWGFG